tara:strand:- start:206 stop:388 length:183 start_codon:yes stop_codon:yes gene_type:complete
MLLADIIHYFNGKYNFSKPYEKAGNPFFYEERMLSKDFVATTEQETYIKEFLNTTYCFKK